VTVWDCDYHGAVCNRIEPNKKTMEIPLKRKLLIVEDDVLQMYIAKKVLSERYDVIAVTSGYEAMNALENDDFSIVLMNVNLGDADMDGMKAMRQMRLNRKFEHSKIVAVSAFGYLRDWYISVGFNELIVKPIMSDTIFGLLEEVHENKSIYCVA